MLSRLVAGIHRKNNTLVINFPGSSKAVKECFDVVQPILKHLVDQIKGTKKTKHYHEKKNKDENSHGCSCFSESTKNNPNESPFPMMQFQQARELAKTALSKIGSIESSYPKLNSVLLEDVFSIYNIPAHPTSIKDGYAIISKDSRGHDKPKIV